MITNLTAANHRVFSNLNLALVHVSVELRQFRQLATMFGLLLPYSHTSIRKSEFKLPIPYYKSNSKWSNNHSLNVIRRGVDV